MKPGQSAPEREDESTLGHYSTIAGVVLCLAIFVYLSFVARRAVDEELDEDDYRGMRGAGMMGDSEETVAFLDHDGSARDMDEVPEARPASRTDARFVYAGREEEMVGL